MRTTPPKVTTRLTSLHTNLRCGSTWRKHLAEVPGGSARPHFTAQGHLPSSHWRRPRNTQDQGHVTARTKVNPYPQGYTRSQYLAGFQSTHPTLFRNAEGAPLPAEALSLHTLWQKPRKSLGEAKNSACTVLIYLVSHDTPKPTIGQSYTYN